MSLLQRKLKFFPLLLAILLFGLANWINPVRAQTPAPDYPVYIYLFWGEGCPHCAKAIPFFDELAATYPQIKLSSYEVYSDAENQKLFSLMAQKYGIEMLAVPTIFVGPYYLQGYAEEANASIEEVIVQCIQSGCVDLGAGVIKDQIIATTAPTISATRTSSPTYGVDTPAPAQPENTSAGLSGGLGQTHEVEIPLLGKVNLDSKSLFITTALIALVDGFNPCSLWVLTMLLALTLHTGSRKKVFIIGMVFLTVTAGIYALFIAGLFSILKITSFMGWIRILVALIALFFALVNIKDYFW